LNHCIYLMLFIVYRLLLFTIIYHSSCVIVCYHILFKNFGKRKRDKNFDRDYWLCVSFGPGSSICQLVSVPPPSLIQYIFPFIFKYTPFYSPPSSLLPPFSFSFSFFFVRFLKLVIGSIVV